MNPQLTTLFLEKRIEKFAIGRNILIAFDFNAWFINKAVSLKS